MSKLLLVGDVHYSTHQPIARLDSYSQAILTKLREVIEIAKLNNVEAIVFAGDMFNVPEASIPELIAVCSVLECEIPIYVVPGNHDMYGYNITSLSRSSLTLVSLICKNVHILLDNTLIELDQFILTGQPYSSKVDINNYGYSQGCMDENVYKAIKNKTKVHTVHGMLLPTTPVFDKFTLIKDIITNADIIFAGHYHSGFKTVRTVDTEFINNGAICRESASELEISRVVGVTIIDAMNGNHVSKFIPLKAAKPGVEVLTRSHLVKGPEAESIIVDEFNTLLKNSAESVSFKSVYDMIHSFAEANNVKEEIVTRAIKLVEIKQEERKKVGV